jgi:hypothetical protein
MLVSRESIVTFYFQHPPGYIFVSLVSVLSSLCLQENGASQLSLLSVVSFEVAISGRINVMLTPLFVEQWRHFNLLHFLEH